MKNKNKCVPSHRPNNIFRIRPTEYLQSGHIESKNMHSNFTAYDYTTLGVKVRNIKMDFNTGGTWRRVGQ